jgi:hypothetical protein
VARRILFYAWTALLCVAYVSALLVLRVAIGAGLLVESWKNNRRKS